MVVSLNTRSSNNNAVWFLVFTCFYIILSIAHTLGDFSSLAMLGSRLYGILASPNMLIITLFILASSVLEHSKELDKINLCEGDLHVFSKVFYFTVLGTVIAGPAGTVGSCMILLSSFGKALLKDDKMPVKLIIGLILLISTMGQLVPPGVLPIMINDVMTNTVQSFWFGQGIYDFDIAASIDLMNALYIPSLIILALTLIYIVFKVHTPTMKQLRIDLGKLFKANILFVSGIIALCTLSILNMINVYQFGYLFIFFGLIITFLNKNLNKDFLVAVTKRTVTMSGGILVFIVIGNLIAFVFQINGNYDAIINYFRYGDISMLQTHISYIGHLLILCMFLDPFEITYVFLPFTSNIMLMQQLDTVYVGALTTLVLQVAYLTPPIGLGLFYLKLMFRDISFKDIAMSAIPMMVIQITSIAIYVIYALYMSNRL